MSRQRHRELVDEMIRKEIQAATIAVILESDAGGLSMDRIAERAGVAKGTLYNYFKNKHEVVESAMKVELAPLDAEIKKIFDSDRRPDEKIEEITYLSLKFFDDRASLFRLILNQRDINKDVYIESRMDRQSHYWAMVSLLAKVLDEGIACGIFRKVNSMKMASVIAEAIGALNLQRIAGSEDTPLEDDVRQLADFIIRGLAV